VVNAHDRVVICRIIIPVIIKNNEFTLFFCGGVHAFSARFVGVFEGISEDFYFGDFEACGSGVFDVKTGTKWNAGISAEDKYKKLRDGTTAHYVYYGCTRARDRDCKNQYIREEELIAELLKIFDQININELGMKKKLEDEIRRFSHFQRTVFGSDGTREADEAEVNIRAYAKYLLRQSSISEKRELLGNLRSRLVYLNKEVYLLA